MNAPTASQWLANIALDPITREEQMQDELERLQSELDLAHSREDLDEYPRTSAEFAGRQYHIEKLCNRIAELKKGRG